MANQKSFSVRCIFLWNEPRSDQFRFTYEERITLWKARDFARAIAKAETEALEYASCIGATYTGLAQAYWMCDRSNSSGIEVFSLLRDSNFETKEYLDTFFDTGDERQQLPITSSDESPESVSTDHVDSLQNNR